MRRRSCPHSSVAVCARARFTSATRCIPPAGGRVPMRDARQASARSCRETRIPHAAAGRPELALGQHRRRARGVRSGAGRSRLRSTVRAALQCTLCRANQESREGVTCAPGQILTTRTDAGPHAASRGLSTPLSTPHPHPMWTAAALAPLRRQVKSRPPRAARPGATRRGSSAPARRGRYRIGADRLRGWRDFDHVPKPGAGRPLAWLIHMMVDR